MQEASFDYATEHNLLGVAQCSVSQPEVSAEAALDRGCATGEVSLNEGSIQNEKETSNQEEAL